MAEIDKELILYYVKQIDSKLEGYTKKIDIFCIGGTALTLRGEKNTSLDIDFMVPHKDFVALTSVTGEIEYKDEVRIDIIQEGEHGGYILPSDYKKHAQRMGLYEHLNLYLLSEVDILLTKILSGRPKDYVDIKELARKIDKHDLLERFNQLRFEKGKKKELKTRFDKFMKKTDK